ncbi:maltokinase N-terminal cap-like domain-containing protein [Nocardioides sp.]|uniref:maltokinase N-terminal cap-like domain-containing protein n=1 Tax=Nocardioides sp. TaxID=35761 RepID=UPI002B88220E|nr:hypothetical protein [Nocardioides sp.]HXH77881.1 hypothetical protein [Nocardioides sp.]
MAIIHRATISPTKLELLDEWLAGALPGDSALQQVGSYRFDDPDGEVGVEALLVTRGRPVRHVVLTYRATPHEAADAHLITTMEHSVLGRRWVYDGRSDPVAVAAYRRALAAQQQQAPLEVWDGDSLVETRAPTVELSVRHPAASPDALDVRMAEEITPRATTGPSLFARWAGGEGTVAWVE